MSTPPTAPAEWVWLARIRRPQGRKGEVFADILTDFPEKFAVRKHLWLIPEGSPLGTVSGHDSGSKQDSIPGSPLGSDSRHDSISGPRTSGFVTGHDFSRAEERPNKSGALAPAPRQIDLIHHWLHKGGIVLHFAGIDSISAAETLAGLIVAIPHSERAPLADDEVYIADLIGCTLVDVSPDPPQTLGAVEDVDRTAGPAPLLIVNGPRGEILVPFAKSYLRKIDLENRRLEMALPEGLSDLNQS
jgi:16S rRNA processing protein RimM